MSRKKHVIVLDKQGKPKPKPSRVPKSIAKGKHKAAARQEKAWKAAQRKTT
jgi:hypothetical protein